MPSASSFTPEERARADAIRAAVCDDRRRAPGEAERGEQSGRWLGKTLILLLVAAVHLGGYFAYRQIFAFEQPIEPLTAAPAERASPLGTSAKAAPPPPPARQNGQIGRPTVTTVQVRPTSGATPAPSAQVRPPPPQRVRSAPASPPAAPSSAPTALPVAAHAAKAREYADHYFRYEHRFGSGSIYVSSLEVRVSGTREMSGWDRYITTGIVGVQYFDSAGRSSSRTTLGFEATTRELNGAIEVTDFDVKSSAYISH